VIDRQPWTVSSVVVQEGLKPHADIFDALAAAASQQVTLLWLNLKYA